MCVVWKNAACRGGRRSIESPFVGPCLQWVEGMNDCHPPLPPWHWGSGGEGWGDGKVLVAGRHDKKERLDFALENSVHELLILNHR